MKPTCSPHDQLIPHVHAGQRQRLEGAKALADLKAKGMQTNELSASEASRMRGKLEAINTSIAANVGKDLWDETQAELAKMRKK